MAIASKGTQYASAQCSECQSDQIQTRTSQRLVISTCMGSAAFTFEEGLNSTSVAAESANTEHYILAYLAPPAWVQRILWATPTAAGPSGDRSFGRLIKEVGKQTCRSADLTQCALINDRALGKQARSSMRAAVEVSIHASGLVHEKRVEMQSKFIFMFS